MLHAPTRPAPASNSQLTAPTHPPAPAANTQPLMSQGHNPQPSLLFAPLGAGPQGSAFSSQQHPQPVSQPWAQNIQRDPLPHSASATQLSTQGTNTRINYTLYYIGTQPRFVSIYNTTTHTKSTSKRTDNNKGSDFITAHLPLHTSRHTGRIK